MCCSVEGGHNSCLCVIFALTLHWRRIRAMSGRRVHPQPLTHSVQHDHGAVAPPGGQRSTSSRGAAPVPLDNPSFEQSVSYRICVILHLLCSARILRLLTHSSPSKMESLGGYPVQSSGLKARRVTVLLSVTLAVGCLLLLQTQVFQHRTPEDFYSFSVRDAKGRTFSLEKYRGKVSLVVNVASRGDDAEHNYKFLQELHRELGTSHFTVLAFPCAQFGDTEPGTGRDAELHAKSTHSVTFPFFSRVKLLGPETDPAFKFLSDSVQKTVKWNFWKFLVNADGKVARFWRNTEPLESVREEARAMVREIILKKRAEL